MLPLNSSSEATALSISTASPSPAEQSSFALDLGVGQCESHRSGGLEGLLLERKGLYAFCNDAAVCFPETPDELSGRLF